MNALLSKRSCPSCYTAARLSRRCKFLVSPRIAPVFFWKAEHQSSKPDVPMRRLAAKHASSCRSTAPHHPNSNVHMDRADKRVTISLGHSKACPVWPKAKSRSHAATGKTHLKFQFTRILNPNLSADRTTPYKRLYSDFRLLKQSPTRSAANTTDKAGLNTQTQADTGYSSQFTGYPSAGYSSHFAAQTGYFYKEIPPDKNKMTGRV